MAKKPKGSNPVPRRALVASEAEPGPVAAQNVILERMEEQQRVVIESVTMSRESLGRTIRDVEERLTSKIEVLEIAVRKNSADIQKLGTEVTKNSADIQKLGTEVTKNSADIQKLGTEVTKNSADIQSLSAKLDTKTDASRTSALEQRVEALEAPVS